MIVYRGGVAAAPSHPSTPTLVQHASSSTNPVGQGITGNTFKLPMPNPVLANNCIVLCLTYTHGSTPTITDNNGNTWNSTADKSVDAGVGAYVSGIWVHPNANAGATVITVAFGGALQPFQYDLYEYAGVATTTPVNGTAGTAGVTGPSLTCGSFTPTNNDANGGNMIVAYYALAGGANGNPTGFAAGGSFTMMSGDITWASGQGFPHAAATFLQTTSAAINPAMTATADSVNGYNCVAVALKSATAGTVPAAGIHVNKVLHFTSTAPTSPQTLQIPSTGNLRVLVTANNPSITNISSVVDSESHTWTEVATGGDSPQMFYWQGATPNAALTVTITFTGTNTYSFRYFDISFAATSAFDQSAFVSSTTANNLSSISNQPSGLTPTSQPGLTIATMGLGDGPGQSVTAPTGALWVLTTYAGETDTDLMENADACAFYYYSTTASQAFSWTMVSQTSNSAFSTAACFKSA
jgi:hypothetical protein